MSIVFHFFRLTQISPILARTSPHFFAPDSEDPLGDIFFFFCHGGSSLHPPKKTKKNRKKPVKKSEKKSVGSWVQFSKVSLFFEN